MKYDIPISADPVDVFCSYAREDSGLQSRLQNHLAGLIHQKLIRSWHNGMIIPGDEIVPTIAEKLDAADLVLLLISSSFLNDCWDEMEKALERYDAGEAQVIAILLRPCFCPDAPYQRVVHKLPVTGGCVSEWRSRDKAFSCVVEGIRQAIVDLPIYKLPVPETTFIGRENEMRDLEGLLAGQDRRLLVLHGPDGSGKTRLAQEVADKLSRRFRNGVCQVSLGQAKTAAALPVAIAQELEVKEGEDSPLEKSLRRFLRPKHMLLLLDGCDRVPDADRWLNGLLAECPHLQILVTSRKSWKKAAANYRLSASLAPSDAVKLFVQHAPAPDSNSGPLQDENAVAEICAGLHGLALAVELVAAQADRFRSPEALQRLSGLDRQRDPLRAAISWIVSLLAPEEQKLFSRLSVFPGSFTAEAAEAICCAAEGSDLDLRQGLESLREKRLLRPEGGDRYKMPDVLRQLAAEFLDERERNRLKRRHFDFFLALVETVEPRLTSAERDGWLERLEAENENLRAALTWSQKRTDSEPGLRLAGALFWFWNLRAYFSEGRRWLEPALKKSLPKRTAGRARALYAAGGLAFLQGDQGAARAWLEESVDLWREVGDPKRLGFALIILGMVAQQANEFEAALACEKESVDIFRRLRDEWGLALALNDLGNVHRAMDDHKAAIEHYRLSLPKWRKMNDPWGLPLTLDNLGYLEMLKGDKAAAHRAFREALKVLGGVDDRWGLAETIKYLADLAVRQGEDDQAERLYRESLDLNRKIGRKPLMVGCLAGLAGVALRHGFLREAARLSGAVDALRGPVRPSSKLLDHEMYEETRKALREKSRDASALRHTRSQGKKVSLEEITTYALALNFLTTPAERPSPPPAPERKAVPEAVQQAVPEFVKTQP